MVNHGQTPVDGGSEGIRQDNLPVFLSKELEACLECPVEGVVVLSGDTGVAVSIEFIIQLSSIYLHANEREDEYHEEDKHEQVDKRVQGLEQCIQDDSHLLHCPEESGDTQNTESTEDPDGSESG